MAHTILILGAGWGGLTAAHTLRSNLPADDRVILIEKKESFVFYPSFLRSMIGEKTDLQHIESPLKKLMRKDLEIIQEEILRIDPLNKTVQTTSQLIKADFLIIALGAATNPSLISGFTENAINLFDTGGSFEIYKKLQAFKHGRIVVLVSRLPFRCPPSPYEATMLAEDLLRKNGVRNQVELAIYTPEKFPMPSAGAAVGEKFRQILTSKNIQFNPEYVVKTIEPGKISFSNGEETSFDLLIGIPPHTAPEPVIQSGLTDVSGYIAAHPQTMELLDNTEELTTKYPGVYAIGDVASVQLMNGKYLPKGGVFAEEQAQVVAKNILAKIHGEKATHHFNGKGVCYVDMGDNLAAEGDGDFYAYPDPFVQLKEPSPESRIAKHEFERIFEYWFSA
ncbi:MAG: FAD-dependent oxidoreductase [Bacteroidetes bacterium]|nr:FAD-dependent oxidoreductase [Bacteroidota bacterium]